MASNTNNLGLLKKDPVADGNDTFNIRTILNENWDKIDEFAGKTTPISKGGTGATTAAQALANLGGIAAGAVGNLHVWERVQTYAEEVPAGYTLGDEINGFLYVRKAGSANKYYEMTLQYGSNIGVSYDGTAYISDVTSYTNYPGSTDMQNLLKKMAGKYFKIVKFTYPDYFTSYVDELVYIPATATITLDSNNNMQTDYQVVTGTPAIPAETTTDYLTSTDRNAYTDGTVDNTTITYLGQLGGGARIEVGSYVGTGTYGSSNPCSLTFNFEPKVVIFNGQDVPMNPPVYIKGVSTFGAFKAATTNFSTAVKVAASGKTISWYHATNVNCQGNVSGSTYHYIAIG